MEGSPAAKLFWTWAAAGWILSVQSRTPRPEQPANLRGAEWRRRFGPRHLRITRRAIPIPVRPVRCSTMSGSTATSGSPTIYYRASAADCGNCECRKNCCHANTNAGRSVVRAEEAPAVAAFRVKMATEEAKQIYRQRGAVAEFPNAWIKTKIGLRQLRLRGLAKVIMETLWACLTYNIQQWIRLRWRELSVLRTV